MNSGASTAPSSSILALCAISSASAGALFTLLAIRAYRKLQKVDPNLGKHVSHKQNCGCMSRCEPLPRIDLTDASPREGHLSWDDYFMALAFLSAQRSKDPSKQVGACIVDNSNIILGIGYNGFPRGCTDRQLPWAKKCKDGNPLNTKYPYVVHAEANALLNKNTAAVSGARVYVTMFPCNECAKLLIQAGIREVVFHEAKGELSTSDVATSKDGGDTMYVASLKLLRLAGIKCRQHLLKRQVTLP